MAEETTEKLIITKHLDWQPSFKNEIWINKKSRIVLNWVSTLVDSTLEVTIKHDEIEITCVTESGPEYMSIPLDLFKRLIDELEESNKTK